MRDCQDVLKNLFHYLDHETNAVDTDEIKAHIDLCRECFGRVEFERLMRDHFKSKTNHICPDELKKRILNLIEKY